LDQGGSNTDREKMNNVPQAIRALDPIWLKMLESGDEFALRPVAYLSRWMHAEQMRKRCPSGETA
jgi:hypothetical protein